jgi:archaeal flagellar protein FlaJ
VTQRDPLRREEIMNTISTYITKLSHTGDRYGNDFKTVFMRSGLNTYIDDYLRQAAIITGVATLTFTFISVMFFKFVLRWAFLDPRTILLAFATALIGSAITGTIFIFYPYYRRYEDKNRIEEGLIYFLSTMAVLSASGMSIERIIGRIAEVEDNPPLIHLAKKFLMDIRLFGMDVRTALRDIAEMSPSNVLYKQFESMRTALSTSGDLKSLLLYEVDRQIQVKREKLKAKINTLVYVGELYVALMVLTPIIFIIIISVMSVLGTSVGGGAVIQLNVIVFIGLPIMGGVFMVLLDQTLGRED